MLSVNVFSLFTYRYQFRIYIENILIFDPIIFTCTRRFRSQKTKFSLGHMMNIVPSFSYQSEVICQMSSLLTIELQKEKKIDSLWFKEFFCIFNIQCFLVGDGRIFNERSDD